MDDGLIICRGHFKRRVCASMAVFLTIPSIHQKRSSLLQRPQAALRLISVVEQAIAASQKRPFERTGEKARCARGGHWLLLAE